MVKSIILIIVIMLAIVFSGCTGSKDVTSAFKAIPEVQQFLSEHPTAKITMTYWSKEDVEKSANEISQQCDKTITPVAMYKATVSEGDLKIISWINADSQIVMCSATQGNSISVKQPVPTTVQTQTINSQKKAPSMQLRIQATDAAINLIHNGGDSLIMKDERITITDAVTDASVDGITGITLNSATFQNGGTIVDTLGAGSSIIHSWGAEAPAKGTILKIMLQDIPSGQVITQMQVTVIPTINSQKKAPSVQLRINANVFGVTIIHNGGDSLIMKDERITITDAVTDAPVDGITDMAMSNTTFQNGGTIVDTFGAGSSITHKWDLAPKGVLKVKLQDIPSGQVITLMQMVVTG
ncbi:Uncharacterised protein [uncultured archaeon]|nr:Uncharacterised protein [uncultured archaeon]